jgi:hypothetical protein
MTFSDISLFRNISKNELKDFRNILQEFMDHNTQNYYLYEREFEYILDYNIKNNILYYRLETLNKNLYFEIVLNDNYLSICNNILLFNNNNELKFKEIILNFVNECNKLFKNLFLIHNY